MRLAVLGAILGGLGCAGGGERASQAVGLDPADYDRWRQPERVIAALDLAPGQAVADVGAGRGYFTFRIAEAVGPRGRVTATDVDPRALTEIARGALARAGLARIEPRAVRPDDPGLAPGAYDRILLAQVDHLLPDRAAYLARLRPALAPNGRLAVQNRLHHRDRLLAAAARAGYRPAAELTDLQGQFLIVFEPTGDHR
jgi:predicted methyltransferase